MSDPLEFTYFLKKYEYKLGLSCAKLSKLKAS